MRFTRDDIYRFIDTLSDYRPISAVRLGTSYHYVKYEVKLDPCFIPFKCLPVMDDVVIFVGITYDVSF
jgi:hypothetical protein